MSDVTVKFSTDRARDLPRVGQRKRVRVNGRPETLYVKRIVVEASTASGGVRPWYEGEYRLVEWWAL